MHHIPHAGQRQMREIVAWSRVVPQHLERLKEEEKEEEKEERGKRKEKEGEEEEEK